MKNLHPHINSEPGGLLSVLHTTNQLAHRTDAANAPAEVTKVLAMIFGHENHIGPYMPRDAVIFLDAYGIYIQPENKMTSEDAVTTSPLEQHIQEMATELMAAAKKYPDIFKNFTSQKNCIQALRDLEKLLKTNSFGLLPAKG